MALNTPYKRINPNSINYAAMGQRDPWFALGYALGEGYWNNYNARGAKKSIESGKEQLDEYFSGNAPSSQPAPQDIIDQAMTISVGGNTVGEKDVKKASNGEAKGTVRPELDHGMLKWGYTVDKYKDNPNPVGDSIAAKDIATSTAATLSRANMDNANWDEFESAFRQKMTLDNRNAYQQDAAIAAIKPMFEARKKEYDNKLVDQLAGMWQEANNIGDHSSASKFASRIGQINPALGKHLLDSIVTPKDKWKAEVATNAAIAKASAKTGGKGVKDSDRITASKAVVDHYNEWRKNNPDKSRDEYPRVEDLNAAQDTLAIYAGKGSKSSETKTVNYNDLKNKYKKLYADTDEATVLSAIKADASARKFFDENPEEINRFTKETGIIFPFKGK